MLSKMLWLVVALFASSSFASQCPKLERRTPEAMLSSEVGAAVLYPMNVQRYEQVMNCLFELYVQQDFALASLKWDVTHALLRVMAAHPSQFFTLLGRVPSQARDRWLQSFEHAALWPREVCPSPDPISLARSAVLATHLQGEVEPRRREVLAALSKVKCRVAQ
jgi:hypothetical protein